MVRPLWCLFLWGVEGFRVFPLVPSGELRSSKDTARKSGRQHSVNAQVTVAETEFALAALSDNISLVAPYRNSGPFAATTVLAHVEVAAEQLMPPSPPK